MTTNRYGETIAANAKPQARKCAVCHKPKGCMFHVIEINGRMRSMPLHMRCIPKARKIAELNTKLFSAFSFS